MGAEPPGLCYIFTPFCDVRAGYGGRVLTCFEAYVNLIGLELFWAAGATASAVATDERKS